MKCPIWHRLHRILEFAQPLRQRARESHKCILLIVFMTNLADNVLLTAVDTARLGPKRSVLSTLSAVPIIPTFLLNLDKVEYHTGRHNLSAEVFTGPLKLRFSFESGPNSSEYNVTAYDEKEFSLSAVALSENGRVGWLLSSKAIVQLFANSFVGPLCNRVGYPLLLLCGSVVIFMSSIVFALAESYVPLLIARSLQGLGSAASVVSGMSIVAQCYPDDRGRSRAMGIAMSGAALGVLRYPFGGFMYTFVGKTATFLIISLIVLIDIGMQWFAYGLETRKQSRTAVTPLHILLKDRYILIASGAVMLTTMSMSVLEPTVPLWIMGFMDVKKWELGLVFLPDSIGYFVGTNCFGVVAKSIGRWICTLSCMLLIALCQICLPFATAVPQLILPHFGLGLGLGITDVAIMPLLALLVDMRHQAFYGYVYAIAQLAVCLAYSVGPSVAGIVVRAVGFPWLMRGMALLNILYCPLCYILSKAPTEQEEDMSLSKQPMSNGQYVDSKQELDEASFSYGRLYEDDD